MTNLKKSKRKHSKFNQFKASDCVFFLNEEWLTVAQWQLPGCESPCALPGLAFKTFAPIKVLTVRTVRSSVWVEVFVLQPPPHSPLTCSVFRGVRGEGEALTHRPKLWQGACEGGRLIRFFFSPSPELICNSVFAPELSNTEIRREAELRANEWSPLTPSPKLLTSPPPHPPTSSLNVTQHTEGRHTSAHLAAGCFLWMLQQHRKRLMRWNPGMYSARIKQRRSGVID